MWWSRIGLLGRLYVVIGLQAITVWLLGLWGLLLYPILILLFILAAYVHGKMQQYR